MEGGIYPAFFVCLGLSHFASQRRSCYFQFMTKLEQIERAIAALSPEELKAFAKWFAAFQADVWHTQIEADEKQVDWTGLPKRRWPRFEPETFDVFSRGAETFSRIRSGESDSVVFENRSGAYI
ncbi:hypothetical protein [Mesorhizobium sp. B2-1-3A]|uniref:hypothetical protein n=1 Tax=Mesorhizobium sp. B2-1-3A TaxID=2589971 RepID=UPI001FEF43CA|nr:hypothetical protein [Mesorhizobium sp. B2-1-3A]